jgi:hypothetical protein
VIGNESFQTIFFPSIDLLQEMESEHEPGEHEGFPKSRIKQGFSLEFRTCVHCFSNENNLRDDEGGSGCGTIGEIGDVKAIEQNHAVGGEGAKEKGEIGRSEWPSLRSRAPLSVSGFSSQCFRHP